MDLRLPLVPGLGPPVGDGWQARTAAVKVQSPNCEGAPLQRQRWKRQSTHSRGFTLVELMVTVAVIGILALVAVPSMTSMISNSRLRGQTEEVTASLQLARSEAVRRNQRITACASGSGVACAASANRFVVFWQDPSNAANTELIREIALSSNTQVSGDAAGIEFRPTGLISSGGAQQMQVTVSDGTRYVCVQISGVVSIKKEAC